jgi:hypothetical protein
MMILAKRSFYCVLSIVLFGIGVAELHAEDNPLRKFFPYGVYAGGNNPKNLPVQDSEELRAMIEEVCKDLAEHNINCVWSNNLIWDNLPLWLESGSRHGIRIIPQGGGPPGFVRAGWFSGKEDFARRVEPFYKDLAEKYRDEPALLAWSIPEENRPEQWFYEALADVTQKMAQWDPKHPMISLDNTASTAMMNAQIIKPKVLARDVYVFFADGMNGPYEPIGFKSLLTRECKRFQEAAESCGAVYWIMGQSMSLVSYGKGTEQMSWRYPSPEEIRWQVWAAIQQGAKGFFFFMYEHSHGEPWKTSGAYIEGFRDRNGQETPQYRMAAEVGRQLRPLMPLLLELDAAPPHQEVVYWENTPVTGQTFIHRKTGRRFLIAVNHDCSRIQPVGIELGYWPQYLGKEEKLFDLRRGRKYDYQSLKLTTLLPGDGTIYFVGTEEEWKPFAKEFYGQ